MNILLLHLTTQMKLINTMLSERSVTHKRTHCMIAFHITLGSTIIENNGARNQNSH